MLNKCICIHYIYDSEMRSKNEKILELVYKKYLTKRMYLMYGDFSFSG